MSILAPLRVMLDDVNNSVTCQSLTHYIVAVSLRTLFGISEEEQQSIPLVCIIGCTFFVRFHELPHLLEPVPNLILYTHLAM